MSERTCPKPDCGDTDHLMLYGLLGTIVICNSCGTVLALRRDIEAAPIDMTEEQAKAWVKDGSYVLPGAEAKDPADDEMFVSPWGDER